MAINKLYRKSILLIAILISQNGLAQNMTTSTLPENIRIMQQLKDLMPPTDHSQLQSLEMDYGPMRYRISSAQGHVFKSTNAPLIIRFNTDDGLSDKPGGVPVKDNEFPWIVALLHSNYGTLTCGGSHLGGGWIVTAAHCLLDKYQQPLERRRISILTGTVSLVSENGRRLSLEKDPIIHDQYDPVTKKNDIALLKISNIDSLSFISIPSSSAEATLISIGSNLTVSGWGYTTANGEISTELLKVGVPVVKNCASLYTDKDINPSRQICAGIEGRDSCRGDSGGPLVGLHNNQYVLVGIVSFGPESGCGGNNRPGVYTRATAYTDWINQKIASSNF